VIPWNRVKDLQLKKLRLPPDVSVDRHGDPTTDPELSMALLPLGGMQFGHKGAALASMAEVLSAVMTGMPHCGRLLRMDGEDMSTPRHLGHFFVVIDPSRFVPRPIYEQGMSAYLDDLRRQTSRPGKTVIAPGDREWATEEERSSSGIPIPESLDREFA